jgi:glycosyltransferase involved in cell wall biosynthesis
MEDLSGQEVHFIPLNNNPTPIRFFLDAVSTILRNRYDLVHSHGFTAAMCAALPAFLKGTPHIITAHETLNERQFTGLKGSCKRYGMSFLFRLIDKIHSVSHDAQDNLLEYFPSLPRYSGKLIVIQNGIEVKRFTDAVPRDIRGELGLADDVFLIGFLGRFMSPKGFRYLVDAIELLLESDSRPKKPLVLTFYEGGFIREEKQAIRERGLESYFRFMPFTANVASTIKGLDVVTMPSISEACGLLAMETLICGVPFIGSNCIGLREVLKGTPAIVVEKADASDLAKALIREMKSSSKDTFANFSEKAATMFDVTKTSKSLAEIYMSMTSGISGKGYH